MNWSKPSLALPFTTIHILQAKLKLPEFSMQELGNDIDVLGELLQLSLPVMKKVRIRIVQQ